MYHRTVKEMDGVPVITDQLRDQNYYSTKTVLEIYFVNTTLPEHEQL